MICNKCQKNKNIDEFAWKNKEQKTKSLSCKDCHKLYARNHYKQNKKKYIDKSNRQKKDTAKMIRLLRDAPCMDCKINYPFYCMEFDHREPEKKTAQFHGLYRKEKRQR